jgi:pyruvate dehydrogenase E2 component (dihydrolipoamide acetyltransferase)
MAIDVKLPELGENIEAGDVAAVLVSPGDQVEKDAPLLELETDKAVVEVPAPEAGVVTAIHVKAGDTISVGDTIASLESASAESGGDDSGSSAAQPSTDQAPAVAPAAPPAQPAAPARPAAQPEAAAPAAEPAGARPVPATPAVRRLAREIGVDIDAVTGTGPGGRILPDDVKATAKRLLQAPAAGALPTAPELPDFAQWGPIERTAMNAVRRTTATHLTAAWQSVPAVTQQDKADITELERLRKRFGPRAEAAGGKLTVTAILVKVIATALKVFPQFNASIDLQRAEVVYKRYYHIGIAVDTERGLLVPVIRDADRMNIVAISSALGELSARARGRKLTVSEMQGGTFTISNLGGIGGSHFTPIVNLPEVAILGVSRAALEPVWQDNAFEPRLRLPLSLTYDHRLIDGADGIRFLRWVVEALEQPLLLTLEG